MVTINVISFIGRLRDQALVISARHYRSLSGAPGRKIYADASTNGYI